MENTLLQPPATAKALAKENLPTPHPTRSPRRRPAPLSEDELKELKERLLITLRPNPGKDIEIDHEHYAVIGDDEGTVIAVNKESRQVYSIDSTSNPPLRFINSDKESFLKSIRVYLSSCQALEDADEQAVVKIVDKMRQEFIRIDPPALREEAYWSVILEQVEAGLL